MRLPKGVGRKIAGAGRRVNSTKPMQKGRALDGKGLRVAAIGTAATIGGASAVLDKEGPYADIQESMFGERDVMRAAISAEIQATASRVAGNRDTQGLNSVYYGQPVNPRSKQFPANGQIVFGMWNNRR